MSTNWYCGFRCAVPMRCPSCSDGNLLFMGYGTQRAAAELEELVPGLRVLRMDTDTTRRKFSHEEILDSFRRGDADVLLGTQMVTKGHDFPRVALAGVLNADASLYLDDYRAGERTFAMLTQLIGRAGRAGGDGVAVIQTTNPSSEVIALAARQGTRVLLDECFLDFTDAESAKALLPRYPNLLILKAFTKSYALAGVRVGYCLTADAALLSAMAACTQPWNVSLLAQAAGVAALREQDWLARAKEILTCERAYMTQELTQLGFSVCPSEANYLLFSAPVGLDAALLREGIAIRSCANYAGLGAGWYRTAVRLREENEALLDAMRRVTEE